MQTRETKQQVRVQASVIEPLVATRHQLSSHFRTSISVRQDSSLPNKKVNLRKKFRRTKNAFVKLKNRPNRALSPILSNLTQGPS